MKDRLGFALIMFVTAFGTIVLGWALMLFMRWLGAQQSEFVQGAAIALVVWACISVLYMVWKFNIGGSEPPSYL